MNALLLLVAVFSLLPGCVTDGAAVSKSTTGNLEINVSGPEGVDVSLVRLYLDGAFIGNVSNRMPVLFVKRGERMIRAELPGFQTVEETLLILGEPNHQTLNIVFRKP